MAHILKEGKRKREPYSQNYRDLWWTGKWGGIAIVPYLIRLNVSLLWHKSAGDHDGVRSLSNLLAPRNRCLRRSVMQSSLTPASRPGLPLCRLFEARPSIQAPGRKIPARGAKHQHHGTPASRPGFRVVQDRAPKARHKKRRSCGIVSIVGKMRITFRNSRRSGDRLTAGSGSLQPHFPDRFRTCSCANFAQAVIL